MAWLILLMGGLVAGALLWRMAGSLRTGALLAGAATALAASGYAWQGRPSIRSAPAVSECANFKPVADAEIRGKLMGRAGASAERLAYADAYFRAGRPDVAARVLQLGLEQNRKDPQLWVGLAMAIMAQNDGQLVPAAEFAFREAERAAPGYPGTLFFHGLALARSGRPEEARERWLLLLKRIPRDREERALVEKQLLATGIVSPADVASVQ